jgi:hypothetical protein
VQDWSVSKPEVLYHWVMFFAGACSRPLGKALPGVERFLPNVTISTIDRQRNKRGRNGRLISFFAATSLHAQTVGQLQSEIAALKSSVSALQRQVTLIAQNRALEVGPFVSINPNPVNGRFGCN